MLVKNKIAGFQDTNLGRKTNQAGFYNVIFPILHKFLMNCEPVLLINFENS